MKCFLIFSYLLVVKLTISQNTNSKAFFYTLTYRPDSLNKERLAKEKFVLLIDDSISFFASTNYLKLHESIQAVQKKATSGQISSIGGNSLPKTGFMIRIYNLRAISKTVQILDMIDHNYGVEYPGLAWKITSDTQTVNGISCRKALLEFAGRTYKAWFSETIPISDGPYVFKGLPGLVISISDTYENYKWELTNISDRAGLQAISYNEKGLTWIKRKEMIRLNSYEGRRSRLVELGFFESEWQGISKEDLVKKAEENLRKNNNQIELKD